MQKSRTVTEHLYFSLQINGNVSLHLRFWAQKFGNVTAHLCLCLQRNGNVTRFPVLSLPKNGNASRFPLLSLPKNGNVTGFGVLFNQKNGTASRFAILFPSKNGNAVGFGIDWTAEGRNERCNWGFGGKKSRGKKAIRKAMGGLILKIVVCREQAAPVPTKHLMEQAVHFLSVILPKLFQTPARHENSHKGTKARRFTKGFIIKGYSLIVS